MEIKEIIKKTIGRLKRKIEKELSKTEPNYHKIDDLNESIIALEGVIPLNTDSEFESAVEPAIRYLLKNHNPMAKIYVDYSSAELLSGERCHNLNNEVPD